MPELTVPGGWRLRAQVPDATFTLAVEDDDATAAERHAAFADRCLPLLARLAADPAEVPGLQVALSEQLGALRRTVATAGMAYLGGLAGEYQGKPVLLLLGIGTAPVEIPSSIDEASLLAALIRHKYPHAVVEEFDTADRAAVGIRRLAEPLAFDQSDADTTLAGAGLAQVLVPFPEAGILGSVVGLTASADHIDLAAIFVALIAYDLKLIPPAVDRDHARVGAGDGAATAPGRA